MNLKVLFFAATRQVAGCDESAFDVQEPIDLNGLKDLLTDSFPELKQLYPYIRWAVNEEFVTDFTQPLRDGDEIALIPPVSGGDASFFSTEPIEPLETLRSCHSHEHGATLLFVGTVRIQTQGQTVTHLKYEVYESMANKIIANLIEETLDKWPRANVQIEHRIGKVEVGEVSVAIAVGAPHRNEAYDASRFVIERLKHDVPIFKQEYHPDGSHWVGLGS